MGQEGLVFALVGGCAAYLGWALLLPATLRRRLAQALLRHGHWPVALQRRLQRAAKQPSGCGGCDGCDAGPARAAQGAAQPVVWAPRRRR
jgi:hypothetical protein